MITEDKIDASVERWLRNKRENLEHLLSYTESPVERLLLLAMIVPAEREHKLDRPGWVSGEHVMVPNDPPIIDELTIDGSLYGPNSELAASARAAAGIVGGCWVGWQYGCLGLTFLVAQPVLPISGRNIRPDFVIVGSECRIAIEVDGHDFHERTKEQAARDRSRDRAMFVDGWHVLRFTGSEVWRDAEACAVEIARFIQLESVRRLQSKTGATV